MVWSMCIAKYIRETHKTIFFGMCILLKLSQGFLQGVIGALFSGPQLQAVGCSQAVEEASSF